MMKHLDAGFGNPDGDRAGLLQPAETIDPTPLNRGWTEAAASPARVHAAVVAAPPTALPDIDRTSGGIATGNILTGANTLSGTLGKDYGGSGGDFVAAGTHHLAYGDLVIQANGNYTYTQTTPIIALPAGAVDTYTYDFVDSKGNASNFATLSISLDPEVVPTVDAKTGFQSGSAYDEVITAHAGTYLGLGGDDFLNAVGGGVTLDGGTGNDVLLGGAGDDVLIGGAGADYLNGLGGSNTADYHDSTAPIIVDLATGTGTLGDADGDALINIFAVVGGKGGDTLIGDANGNVLAGGAGNDVLSGEAGDDRLDGGAGADAFDGGNDSDTALYGDAKAAIVLDLADLTKNTGDAKGDTFSGIEIFVGSIYSDTMIGDANRNELHGSYGDDKLSGGAGNDLLEGDFGHNLLDGGDGDDTLYAGFQGGGPTLVDAGGTAYGGAGVDTIFGWTGNDVLDGGDGADTLGGLDGDDKESGGSGNDLIYGDLGNDVLYGGDGNDTLSGDDNNDVLIGGAGADRLIGGNGFDIASYETSTVAVSASLVAGGTVGDAAGDTYKGIEGLRGGSGDDFLVADTTDSTLYGGVGNDVLAGENGNDTLHGGAGFDVLSGAGGTDVADYRDAATAIVLDLTNTTHDTGDAKGDSFISIEAFAGSAFADTMTASATAVTFYGNDGNDKLNGGTAADTLEGNNGNDQISGGDGDDNLYGGDGTDAILGGAGDDTVQGDIGNDKLDGGSGKDDLDGGDGNDTLTGGDGDDLLKGDFGDDKLDGGAGNDTLYGQEGSDTMTGGAGSDTFLLLNQQTGKDKITDFNPAEDILHIGNVLNGPGDDIQDLIDAGVTVTTVGRNLTIGWNGGADGATVANWNGGPVNDIHTLGLILGSHLEVSH